MENLQLELDFNQEEWRLIKGYEGQYQVSNLGRVSGMGRIDGGGRLWKGRMLKPGYSHNGYCQVYLYKNGKGTTYRVNRLVAEAFLPNPNNLPEVNHINEDKTDNRVENLEWCTHQYNCNYGSRIDRIAEKQTKSILQYTLDGKFVKEYPSLKDAARQNGLSKGNICSVLKGNRNHTGGYKWKYKDES